MQIGRLPEVMTYLSAGTTGNPMGQGKLTLHRDVSEYPPLEPPVGWREIAFGSEEES